MEDVTRLAFAVRLCLQAHKDGLVEQRNTLQNQIDTLTDLEEVWSRLFLTLSSTSTPRNSARERSRSRSRDRD